MPTQGISMHKIRQILRLHFEAKLTTRHIARSLNISTGVVSKYIKLATICGLSWPLPDNTNDQELSALFKKPRDQKVTSLRDQLDFAKIHQEMKRKGMTLQLLWEEYKDEQQKHLSYSRYCYYYRTYKKTLNRSMRQIHKAGDKVFIDYSGVTFDIIDPDTGLIRAAEIFVGVLGASSYTFVDASWTQQLQDFLLSQRRMFEFFEGVPALVVPDNLKSAITKTCRYEPDVNRTYASFIEHYGTAVLPARPYRPKDKPKAELGVQLAQRWILARLRHQTIVGLGELRAAINLLLVELNQKPFQKLPGCRYSAFLEIDKPALKALPQLAYEYKKHKIVRAGIDYHVELDGHYYSVPHQHATEVIDLWFNQNIVECTLHGNKIATHLYCGTKGKHSTIIHHMPTGHQKQSQYSKERFVYWAGDIGVYTQAIIKRIFENRAHKEQAYRSALGVLNLAKKHGKERLEKACHYGVDKGVCSRSSLHSIIENNLDHMPILLLTDQSPVNHENVRGAHYYA